MEVDGDAKTVGVQPSKRTKLMKSNVTNVLVSIIMPAHNASSYLDDAFKSVLCQTYRPLEIVVFDDCSTDSTAEMLQQWKQTFVDGNIDTIFVQSTHSQAKGPGYARNQAVANSQGVYLCHLDADDIMQPSRIELQMELALSLTCPTSCLIGSNFNRLPDDATPYYTEWLNSLSTEAIFHQQYRECTIICPSWFMHRQVYLTVSHNREKCRLAELAALDVTRESDAQIISSSSGSTDGSSFLVGGAAECSSDAGDRATPVSTYEGFVEKDGRLTRVPEDLYFFMDHLQAGGTLAKVHTPLVTYRYTPNSWTLGSKSTDLQKVRIEYLQKRVIDKWKSFSIWGYGRDGKRFLNLLSLENAEKVTCFCDVDVKKIGGHQYFLHSIRKHIPIISYKDVTGPLIICVGSKRYHGELETNVQSLNLVEGVDYYHFC